MVNEQGLEMAVEASAWQLSNDEALLLGDFTDNAADGRFHGPVSWANIRGVARLRYWPPRRFGRVQ